MHDVGLQILEIFKYINVLACSFAAFIYWTQASESHNAVIKAWWYVAAIAGWLFAIGYGLAIASPEHTADISGTLFRIAFAPFIVWPAVRIGMRLREV